MTSPDGVEKIPVLVSACLLGVRCRFDGTSCRDAQLERELGGDTHEVVAFCPEEAGALPTPRPPAWIEAGSAAEVLEGRQRVVTGDGADVSPGFCAGAEKALALCRGRGIRVAYLKERSPSCGVCRTHVGGALVSGRGVTAELLHRSGIEVIGIEGRRT